MSRKTDFPEVENTRLDKNIEETLQKEFPLPEKAAAARREAFDKIRSVQKGEGAQDMMQRQASLQGQNSKSKKKWRAKKIWGGIGGTAAAAAAVFSTICITNPAFAQNVPIVGHVFEQIGESMGFSGDYDQYAVPLAEETEGQDLTAEEMTGKDVSFEENAGDSGEGSSTGTADTAYTQTKNGMTVTLSEVYCNDAALYVSLVLKTEDTFPDSMLDQEGKPYVSVRMPSLTCSFDGEEKYMSGQLDGQMVDEYTFAGVLRYDWTYDNYNGEAGEVPEEFTVDLDFDQIVGYKPESELPEMPEDLRAEYEQAMAEAGLSTADEDYESFTEEEKDLELELYTDMWNKYYERYPEANQHPNSYENWWYDGPWDFTFDVTKDSSETQIQEINDVNEDGLGLVSVTKTPFEITVVDGQGADYFTVALDADGEILPYGSSAGATNVWAIQDRDVSKIDIYICDYIEYMDELKGYYWSDDYEENKKTKTFKELLDERALYHKEITF